MNRFVAEVVNIRSHGALNLIELAYHDTQLMMNTLELPATLAVGSRVELGIKPSHIAIAKNLQGDISFSNRLATKVVGIETGALLAAVTCCYHDDLFEVIITTKSRERMALEMGDRCELLIKASELFITRFHDAL